MNTISGEERRASTNSREPQEVAPGVYRLETGPRFLPSNVYFVRSGSSWVLIDNGWRHCGQMIKETVEPLFGVNARPAAVLLTHVHPDHSGSALELSGMWDVPVHVHPADMPLAEGTLAALDGFPVAPLDRWLIMPVMRALPRRWLEAKLTRTNLNDRSKPFEPGAAVPGLPEWECIPTPGHTPGHVSDFRPSDRVLITDAVLTVQVNSLWDFLLRRPGLSGPPWYTSSGWPKAKASIAALALLEPDVLATGHGEPVSGPETARQLTDFSRCLTEKSRDSHSIAAHIRRGVRGMAHVDGEIIIKRPVEEVFDFVADERNEPRYNPEMVRCDLVTEEPIGPGSRFHAQMSMRNRPVQMTVEFTDFQRPRLLASASHLSTMEIEGRLTFDSIPGGTRMAWSWELHPKGALKMLSPLVAHMGRRMEERVWTELKRVLETPVAGT